MKRRTFLVALTWLLFQTVIVGCASAKTGLSSNSDSDADTDTDTDSDSDTDSDTDTDTDSDCTCTDVTDCCDGCYPIAEDESCDDGDLCATDKTCDEGECSGGTVMDCTAQDDQCNLGTCNPTSGDCEAQAAYEGDPCDDGISCTADEVCTSGDCIDPDGDDTLFFEDFADNTAGWTLGTQWEIGPAVASTACSTSGGMSQDPGTDHTDPGVDNGIAGVVIGGCTGTTVHSFYCITSPVIDTSGLTSLWLSYWRWLNSDYDPFMHNTIDVYNGSSWTNIFATGSSPCTVDFAWTYFEYDISVHISTSTQVRWCYDIDSTGNYDASSWNIDDVSIGPTPCAP